MTACPSCKSEDVRVGWPLGRNAAGLLVPLTCKKCGHTWSEPYLPPPTEGERMDAEAEP